MGNDKEFEREDLREVILGSYRVVYLTQGETVMVLRVVHSVQDMVRLAERQPWEPIE